MSKNIMIYGFIWEQWVTQEKHEYILNHNESIIEKLPSNDPWPPLTREMFSITKNDFSIKKGPSLDYSGRLIHFGVNIKGSESPWNEWKIKFENLLEQLHWQEATVNFQIWWADSVTFKWSLNKEKEKDYYLKGKKIPKEIWVYEGNKQWDE